MDRVTIHKINTCFLEELSQDSKKALCLVLKVKNKFVSSYIKNYRVSRLANQLNLSRYFVDKYMNVVLDNEWGVLLPNGDIKIHSFNTIFDDFSYRRKSKRIISVNSRSKVQFLLDELNFMILQKNLEEQEYRAKPKRIHQCLKDGGYVPMSRSEYRWYNRLLKSEDVLDGELVSDGVLGMRRLSELLKCSINSAISFLKRMETRGLVCLSHIKRVFNSKQDYSKGIDKFVSNRIGHFYKSRGKMYQFVGTKIELNFSTIDKRKYTIGKKRYKNNINQAEFVQFSTLSFM